MQKVLQELQQEGREILASHGSNRVGRVLTERNGHYELHYVWEGDVEFTLQRGGDRRKAFESYELSVRQLAVSVAL